MSFCPFCHKCPQCCSRTKCRGQTIKILASLTRFGCKSSSSLHPQGGLHPSLQAKTPFNQVPIGSKRLCKSNQKHVSQRSSRKSHEKVGSGKGGCQVLPGILQPPFPGSQTQQEMEANSGFESLKSVPQHGYLQDGNPGDNPVVLEDRGVGHVAGFQRRILPYPNCPQVNWLLRAPSPEICLQHTRTLLALCRQLGWVVNMNKSELVPKQVFNFVGYRFDLITGRVLPTQDRWQALQEKLRFMKSHHSCTVRQFMSLIGLLTATEKQVCSGRLHMRPIQWHLKRNWHVPEVLEKIIPVPVSPSSFRLVAGRNQCAKRSTPVPSSARRSTIYRYLKRRLGRTLQEASGHLWKVSFT